MSMVKVKTSELTGRALDYAVAVSQGWNLVDLRYHGYCGDSTNTLVLVHPWHSEERLQRLVADLEYDEEISVALYLRYYSTEWGYGGPLIDDFQIYLRPPHNEHVNFGNGRGEWRDYPSWSATVSGRVGTTPSKAPGLFPDGVARGSGPTALVAACRAVVLLRLGDEVEVSQGLMEVQGD